VKTRGYGFQIEMALRALAAGCRVVEVPICFTERRAGQSKMSGSIIAEALVLPWKLRRLR
jgi:dolichol-phosphate mannosyltransferase